jgi:hypothetical protein
VYIHSIADDWWVPAQPASVQPVIAMHDARIADMRLVIVVPKEERELLKLR